MINYVSVNSTTEKPLVMLRPKRRDFWAAIIIFFIVNMYLLFGVLIPFIKTGDCSKVYASDRHKKMAVILALLYFPCLPLLVPQLKIGESSFYNDRMEIKPFLGRKIAIVPYNQMYVWSYKQKMIINLQSVPSWFHPIKHIKVRYLNALHIPISYGAMENSEDLPKAIQIVKEKAFDFLEKNTTLIS